MLTRTLLNCAARSSPLMRTSSPLMAPLLTRTIPARGGPAEPARPVGNRHGFGSAYDDGPDWLHRWDSNTRAGKDKADWIYRLFNRTRIYETLLKSNSGFWFFVASVAVFGSFYWGLMWEAIWKHLNKGKLYGDAPYIYPPDEE